MQQSHTFASRTSQHTDQSLQKSVPAPPKKNFIIFFPALLKKIKTPDTQPMTDKHSDNSRQTTQRQLNLTRTTEAHAHNKGLKEMAGEGVNQTFVLLINSSGRLTVRASKPPLL